MKTMKKIIALTGAIALIAMNAAYAAQIGTTDNTVATWAINSTWDGTSTMNPIWTTASWSSDVQVSAQVAPTLTMTISTWAINFGTLAPNVVATGTLSIVTATNADQGAIISMASNGLQSTTKTIGAYGASMPTTSDWTDFYKVQSSTDHLGTALTSRDIAASQTVLSANTVPTANATTTVDVSAMAGSTTEAGNYSDVLTFTVTGSF